MTRVCHLFDATTGWEQRVGVGHLLDRLPGDRYAHRLAALHPVARAALAPLDRPVVSITQPRGVGVLAVPVARGWAMRERADVIHAWGASAACAAASGDTPMVVTVFDPACVRETARKLLAIARPDGFAIACSSVHVRRRVVEHGIAPDASVVIRPGVDFGLIRRRGRDAIRSALGIEQHERMVVIPATAGRTRSQVDACLASVLQDVVDRDLRVVIPGASPGARRMRRLAASLPVVRPALAPPDGLGFEEIVTAADVLIVAATGDVSTTAIAWAMGARVAVIAPAVHAVAEIIAHKLNGLLFKPRDDGRHVVAIAGLLRDRATQARVTETAHGQAYDVFSVRRFADQYARLYGNVAAGRPAGEGIADPAMIG